VCTEPFKQLAQLATHLEKLKPLMRATLFQFIKEEAFEALPDQPNYEMVKLEEDSLLCGFNPWFRGLDWSLYRRYAPKSIPSTICQVLYRIARIKAVICDNVSIYTFTPMHRSVINLLGTIWTFKPLHKVVINVSAYYTFNFDGQLLRIKRCFFPRVALLDPGIKYVKSKKEL
jgi:hypothetical protein